MPSPLLSNDAKDRPSQVAAAVKLKGSLRRAADYLGCSVSTARYYFNGDSAAQRRGDVSTPAGAAEVAANEDAGESLSTRQDDDGSLVIHSVSKTIKTVDEALREAKVDPDLYRVKSVEVSKHDQGTKVKVGKGVQRVLVSELWRVHVKLEPILGEQAESVFRGLLDKVGRAAIPAIRPATRRPAGDVLLELSLADVHFGKNAWGKETGGLDYNLDVAKAVYANAVHDALGRERERIAGIVMPVGNDLIQVDSHRNETTAGTRQDVSGQYKQVVETAFESVRLSIVEAAGLAPVKVVWVPGNHDANTSYFLCRMLEEHFRRSRHVTFDCGPTPRKYHRHGINLIGWAHGDAQKMADLPQLMANERAEDWYKSKVRAVHIGHVHRERRHQFLAGDTFGSVTVRSIPSLCEPDFWHALHGYVGTPTAAQSFAWSAAYGLLRTENVYARR